MTNLAHTQLDRESSTVARRMLSSSHFPQYSQLDPRWEFEPNTERTMCGIVCTKAVIDFYKTANAPTPSVHDIIATVKEKDGVVAQGIRHAVEVDLLKAQGLIAWRRNWDAPSSDPTWLVDNEGYDAEQVGAIHDQLSDEAAATSITEAYLISIKESLEKHDPVIVSVRAHFGGNKADHQVVVTELSPDGEHIVVMDPEQQPGSEIRIETVERFTEYFNRKAIFTRQA